MKKQAKFLYKIGSKIYTHKSVFIQLRVKTRSCILACEPIVEDMYKKGILYSSLPDLIELSVVGHNASISHTGLISCSYVCSCPYSEIEISVPRIQVFDNTLLSDLNAYLEEINVLYTEENIKHRFKSYLKRLINGQSVKDNLATVYNIEIPSHIESGKVKLPPCTIYEGYEPNLAKEMIYAYSLSITKDSVYSYITVRFEVENTNCFIEIEVSPSIKGLYVDLYPLKNAKVISARLVKSKSKILFN